MVFVLLLLVLLAALVSFNLYAARSRRDSSSIPDFVKARRARRRSKSHLDDDDRGSGARER